MADAGRAGTGGRRPAKRGGMGKGRKAEAGRKGLAGGRGRVAARKRGVAPGKGRPATGKRRAALHAALHDAARAHSTATVLFHTAINARQGLSATEGKALDLLTRYGALTAGQLAEHARLSPASVTELVDRLERKGFVRRGRDDSDRRRVLVELAPERLADLAREFDRFGRSVDALWSAFTAEELEVVLRFLESATAFLEKAADRLAEGDGRGG